MARGHIGLRRVLLVVSLALAVLMTTAGQARPVRQTALITFDNPTWVAGVRLVGTYVIEHDDARMARGGPCTALYRVSGGRSPVDEVVAFHCTPLQRTPPRRFSTRVVRDLSGDILTEYQFAGDSESHGVPVLQSADNLPASPCSQPREVAMAWDR